MLAPSYVSRTVSPRLTRRTKGVVEDGGGVGLLRAADRAGGGVSLEPLAPSDLGASDGLDELEGGGDAGPGSAPPAGYSTWTARPGVCRPRRVAYTSRLGWLPARPLVAGGSIVCGDSDGARFTTKH